MMILTHPLPSFLHNVILGGIVIGVGWCVTGDWSLGRDGFLIWDFLAGGVGGGGVHSSPGVGG